MSITEQQKAELERPLSTTAVKSRKQGGANVSYVEGWHVIAEANRIFGFDGWSRETVEIKCVSERDRDIGQNKTPGHSVSYIAKVRVNMAGVVREGCGAGHGIDRDLGQAHESAIKEAETDAMKRAMMTFGNPFGLALYDKTRANVADEPDASISAYIESVEAMIGNATDAKALHDWWMSEDQKQVRRALELDASVVSRLKDKVLLKIDTLKPKAA